MILDLSYPPPRITYILPQKIQVTMCVVHYTYYKYFICRNGICSYIQCTNYMVGDCVHVSVPEITIYVHIQCATCNVHYVLLMVPEAIFHFVFHQRATFSLSHFGFRIRFHFFFVFLKKKYPVLLFVPRKIVWLSII